LFSATVNSSNANTLFFDPVNQPGNWDNNSAAFANYLTQSTRTTDPGDCGATGGMDDRFDHILCTQPVIDGTDSLQYLDSTFVVIGQDGLHVNKSLIAAPQNESAPDSIINALYYMSEHLPVMLQLAVGGAHAATSVDETKGGAFKIYPNPGKGMVTVSLPQISNGSMLLVMNTLGQVIMNMPLNKLQTQVDLSSLGNGVYWLQLQQNSQTLTRPYIIAK
jgi:Secretion system C-terminal sorting domain